MSAQMPHVGETLLALRSGRSWWAWIRRIVNAIRPHGFAVLVVLACTAAGQIATLMQRPLTCYCADTHSYLVAAQQIMQSPVALIQALRTPGFPLLLAVVFKLTGNENWNAVTVVQAVIAVCTIVECYVLAYWLTQRRWIATVVAGLLGTNLYILAWERVMMTELLSIWAIVTLFLCFDRFVQRPRTSIAVVFALVAFIAVMIRPFNLFLPVLLLALVLGWSWWIHEGQRYGKPVLLSAVLLTLTVGGYMVADARVNGVFGLSWVTNIDTFGKVLEYHLEDVPVDPRYAALQASVDRFVTHNPPYPVDPWPAVPPDPWSFVQTHEYSQFGPGMNWAGGYQPVGAFARSIILSHPIQYLADSIPDVYAAWQAAPWLYPVYGAAPDGTMTPDQTAIAGVTGYPIFGMHTVSARYEPFWVTGLLTLSSFQQGAYDLLPLLLLFLAWWLWTHRRDPRTFMLVAMLCGVGGGILVAGLLSYAEFYRLRAPMDWAMIMVCTIVLLTLVSAVPSALRRPRAASRTASPVPADTLAEPPLVAPPASATKAKRVSPSSLG